MRLLYRFDSKESLEVSKDVREQVDCHDLILDFVRQRLKEVLLCIETSKPILGPIVAKVSLNLRRDQLRHR